MLSMESVVANLIKLKSTSKATKSFLTYSTSTEKVKITCRDSKIKWVFLLRIRELL